MQKVRQSTSRSRLRAVCVAALAGVAGLLTASAAAALDTSGNAALGRVASFAAQPQLRPVCSGGHWPTGQTSAGTRQMQARSMYYCPHGMPAGSRIILMGVYGAPAETDNGYSTTWNMSVEQTPAPWDPTKTYTQGQEVVYRAGGSSGRTPYWIAAGTNTNSSPAPGNANWTSTATDPAVSRITLNGQAITLPTTVNAAGTTVQQGVIMSDPLPSSACTSACWIAIRAWTNSVSQSFVNIGQSQSNALGSYYATGGAENDTTAGDGTLPALINGGGVNPTWRAAAIVGPMSSLGPAITYHPSACIIGNSIPDGISGEGVTAATVVAGGSGAVVGEVFSVSNSGAGAGAVADGALLMATSVSGGVVQSGGLRVIYTGSYNNPAVNASQALPSGTQTLTSLNGSATGVTATLSFTAANGYDDGDRFAGVGYLERALNTVGIAWSAFTMPGDKIQFWATRDYTRLAAIALSGCSTAIVDDTINDVTAGTSAATIEGYLTTVVGQLRALGTIKTILAVTQYPVPTSTDGYLTTVNQTPLATYDSNRITVNAWILANAGGGKLFDGAIDLAGHLENSGTPGTLNVDGITVCLWICDAKHLSGGASKGHQSAAAWVATQLGGVQ